MTLIKAWTPVSRMTNLDDEGQELTIEEVCEIRADVLQGARSLTVETDEGEITGNIKAILVRHRTAILELEDGSIQEITLVRSSTRH